MDNVFTQALKNESAITYTENGALAYETTSNALVDFFAVVGALRSLNASNNKSALTDKNKNRAKTLFDEAFKADPLLATKIVFYARDIREGLGERATFRYLLKYMANEYTEIIKKNINLIPFYGRYDDWYTLVDTPCEKLMWTSMKKQFELDLTNMQDCY